MKNATVSFEEWKKAQREFSELENEHAKRGKELAEKRRRLPWLKVEKDYTFQGSQGPVKLRDLFQGRSQLVVQHFMFAPEWEAGCRGCSVLADVVDGARYHFEPKDVSYVAISRAPIQTIEAYRQRMGWKFKWVSSLESDFNFDFKVSFTQEQVESKSGNYGYSENSPPGMTDLSGITVFYKNEAGEIFRTYSNYGAGDDLELVYGFLDLTPAGRNEKEYFDWIKRHDEY